MVEYYKYKREGGTKEKDMPLDITKSSNSKELSGGYALQTPKYEFKDIILNEVQYQRIKLAIAYDEYKSLLMDKWNMKVLYPENKGLFINLYGESGTGKTMTAHAIAAELNRQIIMVNYAEIESKYVGETSKNLVNIFTFAQENNAVLIFDEADALLSKRVTNMTSSTDVSVNQTKSVLLNIMNDYEGVVVFTTNFISNYDFAFMRRIPFQIEFPLPDEKQRIQIWKHYLSANMPYRLNVDEISQKYEDVSGSDIANCVLNAALYAVTEKSSIVTENYFYRALDELIKAKQANKKNEPRIVSQREVTEEYARKQLGGK